MANAIYVLKYDYPIHKTCLHCQCVCLQYHKKMQHACINPIRHVFVVDVERRCRSNGTAPSLRASGCFLLVFFLLRESLKVIDDEENVPITMLPGYQ